MPAPAPMIPRLLLLWSVVEGIAPSWELRTSQQLIAGLRARSSNTPPLDLLTDLHDAESGLCSEGVWHNCWLGTACVLAARRLRRDAAPDAGVDRAIAASRQRVATPPPAESDALFEAAVLLADSLHELSFDDGFRRRVASGVWRDAEASRAALAAAGEDPAFYAYSRERRGLATRGLGACNESQYWRWP